MGFRASRSVLTLVNRVLTECGQPTVSGLSGTQATVVLEAMNDGCADIWLRQRWAFQRGAASIALVASQRDYSLPANFDRIATPFRTTGTLGYRDLIEFSPEEWWQQGLGTSTSDGSPVYYTVKELVVSLYPKPSSDFITNCPTLEYEYFEGVPARRVAADTGSSWDLPLDFEDAHVHFGRGKLKQYLEYPDWAADMSRYEQALQILKGKYREVRTSPTMKPRYPVISEW